MKKLLTLGGHVAAAVSSLRGGARGPHQRCGPLARRTAIGPNGCGRGRSLAPWPRMKAIATVLLAAVVSVTAATTHAATHRDRRRAAHGRPEARDQGGRRVAPRLPRLAVGAPRPQLPLLRLRQGDAHRPDRRQRGRSRTRWPRSSRSSTGCGSRSGTAPSRPSTARTRGRAATSPPPSSAATQAPRRAAAARPRITGRITRSARRSTSTRARTRTSAAG